MRVLNRALLPLLAAIVLLPAASIAATTSGSLLGDETWSGTVAITGDVTVPAGTTLTILPGAVVRFTALSDDRNEGNTGDHSELLVKGSLLAEGTVDNPILFTSNSASPQKYDWEGIRVDARESPASLKIAHAVVEYAHTGIWSSTGDIWDIWLSGDFAMNVSLNDVVVRHHEYRGVDVTASRGSEVTVAIVGGTVTDCLAEGISTISRTTFPLRFTVTGSAITSNGGIGIALDAGVQGVIADISGNVITENSQGILITRRGCLPEAKSSLVIRDNNISDEIEGITLTSTGCGEADQTIVGNTVHDGGYGLSIGDSAATGKGRVAIRGNEFYANNVGISLQSIIGSTLEVTANKVHDNFTGIEEYSYSTTTAVIVSLNEFYNNSNYSGFNNKLPADFLFNSFQENTDLSPIISLNCENGCRLAYNNLSSDTVNAFQIQEFTVDARRNFWGATSLAQMEAGGNPKDISSIYDFFDYQGYGRVEYADWLSAPEPIPTVPLSRITWPASGSVRNDGFIQGVAVAPDGVTLVEVSTDGGLSWSVAQGTAFWSFDWRPSGDGTFTLLSRVTDVNGLMETPAAGTTVSIDRGLPTRSGSLSGNETWSGTIQLLGDVTVPAGVALTILPGTTVIAPALADITSGGLDSYRTELIVEGTLSAEGTAAAPILMTSGGGPGDWYGVRVNGAARLKGVVVERGQTGVSFTVDEATDELLIRDSTIRDNAVDGIAIGGSGTAATLVRVENSTVSGNGQGGIKISKQGPTPLRPVFDGNTITNNSIGISSDCAPSATQIDALTITGNTIANNWRGIHYGCYPTPALTVALTVTGNYISDNSGLGVAIFHGDLVSGQVTIENNTITRSGSQNVYFSSYATEPSTLNVSGNILSSGGSGITVYAEEGHSAANALIFCNNVVEGNSEGIRCTVAGVGTAPRIEGNIVTSNTEGIVLATGGEAVVSGNYFESNIHHHLYNEGAASVNASGNWWGATTTAEMDAEQPYPSEIAKIYDAIDNAAKGPVTYSGWLSSAARPPDPTLAAVSSPTTSSSQSLTGTKDTGTAIVINGVEVVPADLETTWSFTFPLNEGRNDMYILARNAAGLNSAIVRAAILRDTTPPRVYASVPAGGATLYVAVGAIVLALADDATTIDTAASLTGATVRDAGNAAVAGTWTAAHNNLIFTPAAPLGAGSYTVTVHPTDAPQNATTAEVTFSVDVVAPAAPAVNALPAATNLSPYPLSGTKESGTSIWLDGAPVVALDGLTSWTYGLTLHEGDNAHFLSTRDSAGNQSPEVRFDIVLDSYPPVLAGVAPVDGSNVNVLPGNVSFSYLVEGTALDAAATQAAAVIRNSSNQIVPGSWSLPAANIVTFTPTAAFAENTYSASLTSRDLAGNTRLTNLSFTYDATSPQVPTLDPVTSPTAFAVQTLSGTKSANSCIWINGAQVVPATAETTWSYTYRLTIGLNSLVVVARDLSGNTSGEVDAIIEYNDSAPLPVSNLWTSGDGIGTTAVLYWLGYDEQGQGDVALYRIYLLDHQFSQVSDLTPTATVAVGGYHYFATGLSKGATYYCAVVAVDTQGNALTTVDPVQVVPRDVMPPENVTNLLVQSLERRLVFTWSPSADTQGDLSGYKVYFNTDEPVPLPKTQLSFDRSDLAEGTAYPCRVVSVDGDGNQSGGVNLVGVTLMANPANVAVLPWSGYATVSWSPASPAANVRHYAVYADPAPFTSVNSLEPRAISTGTTANVAGLTNNTLYYFAVTAVNTSDGERKTVTTVTGTPVTDIQGPTITNVKFEGTTLVGGQAITKPGTVTLNAIDGAGVSRVEFAVDGTLQNTDRTPDYAFLWNVAALADGSHTFSITAYDSLGHSTRLDYGVSVALATPGIPMISSPASGTSTNKKGITVIGTADPYANVVPYLNGVAVGTPIASGATGTFTISLTLAEGLNHIGVAAENRAGTGPLCTEIHVTLDSSLPEPPSYLTALVQAGGVVRLAWTTSGDSALRGYHIYRAGVPFTQATEAQRITASPVNAITYQDTTPADGTWYYRVSAVDYANNESSLSGHVYAISDRSAPRAQSVVYTPHGSFDAASGRTGPGSVDVLLTVSEVLIVEPFFSITPHGGLPLTIPLTKVTDTTYAGSFTISGSTSDGLAYAVFSARDSAGNRGTDIDAGSTILIDTRGPQLAAIGLQPAAPILTSAANPVTVTATFGLDEATAASELSYLLSGTGRVAVAITNPVLVATLPGQAQTWQATFTLPADAGQSAPETITFSHRAVDDIGNQSTAVLCPNSFEVYQGDLPPLEAPQGLTAAALPVGKARLAWQTVEGATAYQIYRQAPGAPTLTALQRVSGVTEFTDAPSVDELYRYAVASVRTGNSQETVGPMSAEVTVTTDSTVPGSPSDVALQLVDTGVRASWTAPAATESLTYRLYRAATQITDLTGLTAILSGITIATTTDATPSVTDHWYTVTAVDPVGNESPPAAAVYLNAQLLPVATLHVLRNNGANPVISWTHPATNLAGFNVYLKDPLGGAADTKLNTTPVAGNSHTDTGYTGLERVYNVAAVDGIGAESPKRQIALPVVTATRTDTRQIQRGLFNRLDYEVRNGSSATVDHLRLKLALNQQAISSAEISLVAGATQPVSLLVGGAQSLPATADLTTTIEIVPTTGELVQIVTTTPVAIGNGMLGVDLLNDELRRGASGAVRFVLTNTGAEEIEIITAKSFGAAASNEISFSILDVDGNVLSSRALQQSSGSGIVQLPNGDAVARIPAGSTYTSAPVSLAVPLSAPESVRLSLHIARIYHNYDQTGETSIEGLRSERQIILFDTSYYGEVQTVNPSTCYGAQPITISGRAIERSSGLAMPRAMLKLVIGVNGLYRNYSLTTDAAGAFTYTFQPNPGESGVYSVAAVHPDLQDHPVQAQFVINGIAVSPASMNVTIPRNYDKEITLSLTAGSATTAHNLRLLFRAEDQVGGVLPQGIHVTPGPALSALSPGQSGQIRFTVWGDNIAAGIGDVKILLVSDETPTGSWEAIVAHLTFTGALPSLLSTPTYIETGVGLGQSITEELALENRGVVDLAGVTLALVDGTGAQAPAWISLGSAANQGAIAPGERRQVRVTFNPASPAVTEGRYTYYLKVQSSNHATVNIGLYASVTQSGIGQALFKLSDIYTGTLDQQGARIQGLAGARIVIQNELDWTTEQALSSDSLGEALFEELSAGSYTARITASNHETYSGRFTVKPGIITLVPVFIEYTLVSVEWKVVETSIPDVYKIVANVTYKTDMPAAVVVADPAFFNLPEMNPGDVFTGQYTVTNYGLVAAEDMYVRLPANGTYRHEVLSMVPATLGPQERTTVPFRITRLSVADQASGLSAADQSLADALPSQADGGCEEVPYSYTCSAGTVISGTTLICFGGSVVPNVPGAGDPGGPGNGPIGGDPCMGGPPCTNPCGCKTASRSTVDNLRAEYNDDKTDLTVKVPGGDIKTQREYYDYAWHWAHEAYNLQVNRNSSLAIVSIVHGRDTYKRVSSEADEYTYTTSRIIPLAGDSGYRWEDKAGNWQEYTQQQSSNADVWLLSSYGNRVGTLGILHYEQTIAPYWSGALERSPIEGTLDFGELKVTKVSDRNNRDVIWYEYDAEKRIAAVRDFTGRRADYFFSNGKLERVEQTVTDTTTRQWTYHYESGGRIWEKIDPVGGITRIQYYNSGNVKQIVDENGIGQFFTFEKFDDGTATTLTTSSGMKKWSRYNAKGELVKVRINDRDTETHEREEFATKTKDVVRDDKGNATTRWYDLRNNLIEEDYPEGTKTLYEYEPIDAMGASFNRVTRTIFVGTAGQVLRNDENVFDQDGSRRDLLQTREGCDAAGTNCLRTTNYAKDEYTADGQPGTVTVVGVVPAADATTVYAYDSATGGIQSITDPAQYGGSPPLTTTFSNYDALGNAGTKTDIHGKVWANEYDHLGRLVSTTDPTPTGAPTDWEPTTWYEYDGVGNRTATVSGINGKMMRFEYQYDTRKNLVRVYEPFEGAARPVGTKFQEYVYNTDDLPIEIIDQEEKTRSREYHNDKRLKTSTDADGNTTTYLYFDDDDAPPLSPARYSKIWRIEYPTYAVEYDYDAMQRVASETKVLGTGVFVKNASEENLRHTSYSYSHTAEGGLLKTQKELLELGKERKTVFEQDRLGREVRISYYDNNGGFIADEEFSYDPRDNRTKVVQKNGGEFSNEYDENNRITAEYRPLDSPAPVRQYEYDDSANTVRITDKEGKNILRVYNALGNLAREEYRDSGGGLEKNIDYRYDEFKDLVHYEMVNHVTDETISSSATFDAQRRKLSESVTSGSFSGGISYSYYANGRKKSFAGPDNVSQEYDNVSRLAGIDLQQDGVSIGSITYPVYVWDSPREIVLRGGMKKTLEYDPLMRFSSIEVQDTAGSQYLMKDGYTGYWYSGNLKTKTRNAAAESFSYAYNSLDMLERVVATDPMRNESFTHDINGNRKTVNDSVVPWNYNANDELLNHDSGSVSFQYDQVGNMTQRNVTGAIVQFEYDAMNRLARVKDGAGALIAMYEYDPFGRRLWKEVYTGATRRTYYLYADEGLVGEYENEVWQRTYGYEPDAGWTTNPIFVRENGNFYWYINDHLGTPQKLVDEAGTVVWAAEYEAFGKATVTTATVTNNLRFPGQYYDAETGLHYNWMRYYDPSLGRYISVDPIGIDGGDLNLYSYVASDPVNRVDPFGLAWFDNTCGRDIPFKPETNCGEYKEDRKYNCPPGMTCDVDGVYPPGGGNPVKICDGCSASCRGGRIVIECHTIAGLLCQTGKGGPVPDDWWNDPDHRNWPRPGDPISQTPQ